MIRRLVLGVAAALVVAAIFMAYGSVEFQALWYGGAILCR